MVDRFSAWVFYVCLLSGCNSASDAEGKPILQRSARDRMSCDVVSELRDFGVSADDEQAHSVVRLENDDLWLEHIVVGKTPAAQKLAVTKVSVAGEPGEDQVVDEGGPIGARRLVTLPDGGFALLWIRGRSIWFAAFDASGAPTIAAKQVEDIEPRLDYMLTASVSSAGNISLQYSGAVGSELVTLDPAGAVLGPAQEILPIVSPLVARPDGGFAMLGIQPALPDLGDDLLFMRTNETGEPQTPPVLIARARAGRTFWESAALAPLGDGYLAAWNEALHPQGPNPWQHPTGGYSIILLRRLDKDGNPLAPAVALRDMRDSIAERRPVLAPFGDDVAVFWSMGAYNYDCEHAVACAHRDRGQFILIDPIDLIPRSELVTILRDPGYPNGSAEPRLGDLLGTELSARDQEILITATLEDDNDERIAPGFASVRCR